MKVLITDIIDQEGIKILEDAGLAPDIKTDLDPAELQKEIGRYDALIVRSRTKITRKLLESSEKLKIIARAGVGVDNIDIDYAAQKGIAVMNAPSGVSNAVAELVIGLLFAVLRNIATADRMLRAQQWSKGKLVGRELANKTIGIIGFGRIGQLVAKRLKSFECTLVVFDPFVGNKTMEQLGVTKAESLDDIYKAADIITLHVPLTDKTRSMINKDAMQKMKKSVIVINTSRGGLINEDDLYEAIMNGEVGGAGIDTWAKEPPGENKLLTLDTVVGTQHLGALTHEAQMRVSIDIASQVVQALKEGTLTHVVNNVTVLKI